MDELHAEMAAFAARHVRGCDDLATAECVPPALWRASGDAGLFGIGLPEAHGGGYAEIAHAAHTLARVGGLPGLALSWSLQCQAARFLVLGFGTEAQKRDLLPKMASGETTLAIAISEPGAGAHPKRLASSARREGGEVVLDGRKHWLTNGPMADLFVVLAVSDEVDGRKRFSAYLVPRDAPGLTVEAMPPLDFLRPSPHGALRLEACRVPAAARLGPEGEAYEAIARPLRDVEDALITGTLTGALAWQIARLAGRQDDELAAGLGIAAERLAALQAVSARALAALDAAPLDRPPSSALAGGFNLMAKDLQAHIAALAETGRAGDPALDRVTRDVTKALDIAREARQARRARLGQALMQEQAEPQ